MNEPLNTGIEICQNKIQPEFDKIWKQVTDTDSIPEYKLLIWGSTVQDKDREPVDLDIIIEYTGSTIEPEQEKSIESILKDRVMVQEFSYVDPLVKHRFETPQIISNSRVSRVYSVTEESFIRLN